MKDNEALQVIMEALNVAIKNGCYGLVETKNIVNALGVLTIAITPKEDTLEQPEELK